MRHAWVIGALVLAAGCVGYYNDKARDNLLRHAAYDLECPQEKLRVINLEEQGNGRELTNAVEGCGHRAVYVVNAGTDRSWIRNAPVEQTNQAEPQVLAHHLDDPMVADRAVAKARARHDLGCAAPNEVTLKAQRWNGNEFEELWASGCGQTIRYDRSVTSTEAKAKAEATKETP